MYFFGTLTQFYIIKIVEITIFIKNGLKFLYDRGRKQRIFVSSLTVKIQYGIKIWELV